MGARRKLTSWKEIADHLGCTVRTAQRWERDSRLPVFRVTGEPGHRVFAFTDELDAWYHPGSTNGLDGNRPVDLNGINGDIATPAPAEPTEMRPPPTAAASEHAAFAGTGDAKVPTVTLADSSGDPAGTDPAAGQVEPGEAPRRSLKTLLRRSWVRLGGAAGIALAAGLAWLAIGGGGGAAAGLHRVEATGATLIGRDADGRELWRRVLPKPLASNDAFNFTLNRSITGQPVCVDLDADGRNEVLAATGDADPTVPEPWVLYCLDDAGRTRWRYQPGQRVRFASEAADACWMLCFDAVDLDGDSRREIVVLAKHNRIYPAKVAVLDPAGRVLGDFINSGWVGEMNYLDLDGDGTREILVGGCNNGYKKGTLFALRLGAISGCSPQPDTPDYRCLDRPVGPVMHYLLFPRDPLQDRLVAVGCVYLIQITPDRILARLPVDYSPLQIGCTVDWFLDHRLTSARVEFSSYYPLIQQKLFEKGEIREAFSPSTAQRLDPVLYWDGERFVPTPTMNHHLQSTQQP
ncbi:MAG TPA: hypothetical protein PLN26_14265 [Acidobacteriota bacterium]|nr:hypothetical protein [Acidobacteriota bacterium]HQG92911.1 hypothetical protein [Acidobacteriota bacterium]